MFVNKTKVLEKGIAAFPSLFIEGAAACGKTTVVNMFLEAHPEVHSDVFFMDKEAHDFEAFQKRLNTLAISEEDKHYIIFENINRELTSDFYKEIVNFIFEIPENAKALLVSREKPARELLELLWKGKMGMVYQNSLIFTAAEVAKLVSSKETQLRADEVYRVTGGWPGCVDMIIKLSEQLGPVHNDAKSAKSLMQRYEVQAYIQDEILDTLSEEEEEIMRRADICPWLNEQICEEVWGMMWPGVVLKDLERKGLLIYNEHKNRWKIASLFRRTRKVATSQSLGRHLGKWYEEQGAIEEALLCLQNTGCKQEYQECVIKHFDSIPYDKVQGMGVAKWKGNTPELCYLRGMNCYRTRDFAGLQKEISRVQKQEGRLADEIYLNLTFIDPEISFENWLILLERIGTKWAPIRLYHLTENAIMFLSGLRELSGLFACSVKEEKRRRNLLKNTLGEKEWIAILLAHVDFNLEIQQKEPTQMEERDLLLRMIKGEIPGLGWRYGIAALYVLNKINIFYNASELTEQANYLAERLRKEDDENCQKYLYAIERLHSLWLSDEDRVTRWLQKTALESYIEITEENFYLYFLRAKGFILLNQHDRAERIIRRLIPYTQVYHRTHMVAELLFQQAIVNWTAGKKGAALRNVIESFLYTGEYRYVTLYVTYGKFGKEVLEAYVDWHRKNEPEKWNKKKKYNYGNVLYMPMEDYLGVILRAAKRSVKAYSATPEQMVVEKLTMMETIILQDINKGLTNAEICVEQNLKLPTVKTHIYSMYKKLGVNSRVQAILKGKELGIVK